MNKLLDIQHLGEIVKELYLTKKNDVPFHGWQHIYFVFKKATEFAEELNADMFFVQAAALTHDLNYLVEINSEPGAGKFLRQELLLKSGFTNEQLKTVETIINEAHTASRRQHISREGMALSDADTLYKALPITPILFASNYITENVISLKKLANKIVSEQRPLRENNIFFYTKSALHYKKWAEVNLSLWENVLEAIQDSDVQELLLSSGVDV